MAYNEAVEKPRELKNIQFSEYQNHSFIRVRYVQSFWSGRFFHENISFSFSTASTPS